MAFTRFSTKPSTRSSTTEHGGGRHGERSSNINKRVALLIAVIALFLAFSETLGKSAQTVGAELSDRGVEPLELLPGQEHPPDGNDRRGRSR